MAGTSKGGKKSAKKLTAKDPNYFSNLAKRSRKPRGGKASPGSFKPGNPYASKGGKASKRGPAKILVPNGDVELHDGQGLDFIETERPHGH
jgi:hypothetical protein